MSSKGVILRAEGRIVAENTAQNGFENNRALLISALLDGLNRNCGEMLSTSHNIQ